ncbi:MAG: CPBP family intramembrane glutamic endopeptidase [Pseudomonadota bacterium]
MWDGNDQPDDEAENADGGFLAVVAGTGVIGVIAIGLAFLLKVPLAPQWAFTFDAIARGIIATAPLGLGLYWFMQSDIPAVAELREGQIDFFINSGFRFTPPRIAAMAVAAGLCEELLFRGVAQTWLTSFMPVAAAIILSNIVFGLLHFRTALYAAIAGGVGVYFGVLFAITDNLLAPMIAHGLYDALALEYARRAMAARAPST